MRSADLVVTPGRRPMRDEIIDRGVDPDKILIVPNGVSAEVMRADARRLACAPDRHSAGRAWSSPGIELVRTRAIGTWMEAVKLTA